jgi:hypothetical protein
MNYLRYFARFASFVLAIFFALASRLSYGVGGKYPKDNMWVFGVFSLVFWLLFGLAIKWKGKQVKGPHQQ